MAANLSTVTQGIPSFFVPNPSAWLSRTRHSAWKRRPTIRRPRCARRWRNWSNSTATAAVIPGLPSAPSTRATARCATSTAARRRSAIDHILASGALPPAFPAVRIDGDPYWDGGIYSNTPIEAVLDDNPRRDSVIFAVNVWNPEGSEPKVHVGGDGPHQGHPVREPRQEPHRAPEADPPPAPHHPRTCQARA